MLYFDQPLESILKRAKISLVVRPDGREGFKPYDLAYAARCFALADKEEQLTAALAAAPAGSQLAVDASRELLFLELQFVDLKIKRELDEFYADGIEVLIRQRESEAASAPPTISPSPAAPAAQPSPSP